jgi:hypothetical protein
LTPQVESSGSRFEEARHRIRRILTGRVGGGIRIDEQQDLAAAHDELIDGVQRLGRKLLGMHDHQHVDVVVDVIHIGGQRADREELLDLRQDGPWFAHPARHRIELALHRQGTHQSDHGLLGCAQFVDELGHVVFQELLPVALEFRNRGAAVRRVRARQTEIQRVAAARLQRLQTELGRPVLLLGERLRIDHPQVHLAAGTGGDLLEEFAHPGRIRHEQRRLLRRRVAREVVIQVDGFLELGQHLPGTGRQRVELVLGEIQAHAAQT